MTTTQSPTQASVGTIAHTGPRISAANPIYGEILDFLIDEAGLLDDDRHAEWLDMLDDEVTYSMPGRKTLYRRDGRGFENGNGLLDDDRLSLGLRVMRSVEIPNAYDRDPAPRMRRFVTNLVVHQGETDDDYEATTSLLITRNRFDDISLDMLTAKREDVIGRTEDGLRLRSRIILADQTAVSGRWTNVFF